MFDTKIVLVAAKMLICGCSATWCLPLVSGQQSFPSNDGKPVLQLDGNKEFKKPKKEASREHQCSYLAHQKNRLVYFADRDQFIWFKNEADNKFSFFLSNCYPVNLKIWDMEFTCSEAAFNAAKFLHKPELAVRFTHLEGKEAWKLAQNHSFEQRADWYQVREKIMLEVLRAKFKQHSDLMDLLLATGNAYLVENSSHNTFWADGGDGRGKNRLGNMLMQIRGEAGGQGIVSKPGKYQQFVVSSGRL